MECDYFINHIIVFCFFQYILENLITLTPIKFLINNTITKMDCVIIKQRINYFIFAILIKVIIFFKFFIIFYIIVIMILVFCNPLLIFKQHIITKLFNECFIKNDCFNNRINRIRHLKLYIIIRLSLNTNNIFYKNTNQFFLSITK